MPTVPPELLGPVGALVLAIAGLIAVSRFTVLLWRVHLEADADDRAQRDRAFVNDEKSQELLRISLDNHKASIAAWNRRLDADAARNRKSDA
jgi:hypothetical protein